mmetsp:Transcript_8758/g.11029  ORF Transcript_8758/g.11029 Transcript_8758/m.11029 type:complete len:183 (-) Transcript_8758:199-747(-)
MVNKLFGKRKATSSSSPVKVDATASPVQPETEVDTETTATVSPECVVEESREEESALGDISVTQDPTVDETVITHITQTVETSDDVQVNIEDESSVVSQIAKDPTEEEEFSLVNVKRVDTLHADIQIPLSAKSGDVLDIEHDGDSKQIVVPSGQRGKKIMVRMISTKNHDEEPRTGALCGCF